MQTKEYSPERRKKDAQRRRRQERAWARKGGPVTVRFVNPETLRPYDPGHRFRHDAGSTWEVVEHLGGDQDDYRMRCVEGTERPGFTGGEREGRVQVLHGEYLHRAFKPQNDVSPSTRKGRGA